MSKAMPEPKKNDVSIAEQIKQMEEQLRQLRSKGHDDALAVITEKVEELRSLGFHYRLVDEDEEPQQRQVPQSSGPSKGRKPGTKMSEEAKQKMRDAHARRKAAQQTAQPEQPNLM